MNFERKVLLGLIETLTVCDNMGDVLEDCSKALRLVSDFDPDKCPEYVNYEGGEPEFSNDTGLIESEYGWQECDLEDQIKWWCQENNVTNLWELTEASH